MDDRAGEPIDPRDDLGARYRRDNHAQFVLFVEQLAVARELLMAGELSKHRMALVAVDNLAELVLYRHKRRLSEAAQESWRDVEPRLDSKDEQRFRTSFNVRVEVGRKGAGPGMLQSVYTPVLDGLDAGLFRVGHRYRNRAYHADHHNAAALETVSRAYFAAVARAFTRLQPANVAGSMSRATSEALRAYGYAGSTQAWVGTGRMLAPAEAAVVITDGLQAGLEVEAMTARDVLVSDLQRRVDWTREMIRELLADGMPEERLEFGLRWTFVWRAISLDPEIVEVERRMRVEWRKRLDEEMGSSDGSFEREAVLNDQRNARVKALLTEPGTDKFDLPQRVSEGSRGIASLRKARNLATLIDRYERLDTAMEEIEDILDEAAIGWDRWVQGEIDRSRGR